MATLTTTARSTRSRMHPHTAALVRAAERLDLPAHVRAAAVWKAWVHFSSRSRRRGANFASLLLELRA